MRRTAVSGRPLRVAVIGAGPAGFHAIEHLHKHVPDVEVDLYDRLPTPYGLVRGGVAPDHPKIKSVIRVYDRLAKHGGFRFLGNVTCGEQVSHEELAPYYDAVIYSTGAQTDRALGIPGEQLPGSHAATEFVGWYNAHPDYRDRTFDLRGESAAVIGLGNVAMDVTRMLATRPEDLVPTDLAAHALDALRQSHVRHVYVLGRRGPVQAAFTNPELKELGQLEGVHVRVDPRELELDPLSAAELETTSDHNPKRNLHTLEEFAKRPYAGQSRVIELRFLVSPIEILGSDRVQGIKLERNRLVSDGKGGAKAEPTGETEVLPVGLVLRSVGYKGVPIPGLPFDARGGIVPNESGRVLDAQSEPIPGLYVSGWIKRGPTGVIGTNKPDAAETVDSFLADDAAGRLVRATRDRSELDALLASRGTRVVSWGDWQQIDRQEQARGQPRRAPREKFTRVSEMLNVLEGEEVSGKR